MALAVRPVFCQLKPSKPEAQRSDPAMQKPEPVATIQKLVTTDNIGNGKIVLQPRFCTLRSYGDDRATVIKTKSGGDGDGYGEVSMFFATLSEYIESSKKSQDLEIISGRLAMVVFAATITTEIATGNSLFRKMDLQGIAEAAVICLAAVTFAATFAWFSSARNRVGGIFTLGCNTFIDNLIDQIVDGLFYESEISDWSDDV